MNRKHGFLLTSLIGMMALLLLLTSIGFEAAAQDDGTPTAAPTERASRNNPDVFYGDPASSTGDAEWTISDNTFESRYPNGFVFTVKASSSAGEIENATVVWSHAPRNQRRASGQYVEDQELFVGSWPGIAEDSLPPWVAVNYQWRFTDVAGNTYTSIWYRGGEYSDTSTTWHRYESEDIIAFIEEGFPEDMGQQVLDAMAAQRETFLQAWGGLLSNKPRAILFYNNQSWLGWRRGETSASLAGQTSSDWGGTVQRLASGGPLAMAWGTVLHEVGHLYQQEFAPSGFPPGSWWNEGNATFFELIQDYDYEQRVRNLAVRGSLPALLMGTGPGQNSVGADGQIRLGYDTGYTFFKWLVVNYGLDAHYQIVQRVRDGSDRNAALEDVTGLSVNEIETQWRVWLGASPDAPTLFPTEPFRFPPTVTPFIFPTSSD